MFKNYQFISAQTNPALQLALLSEPKDSPIFTAYPEALLETMQAMPIALTYHLHSFGFHWITNSFKTDGLPAMQIKLLTPQNTLEGDTLPPGVSITHLEQRKFVVEGVEWCVFQVLEDRPYPTTNWERIDRTYFCAPCSQIGK